MSKTGQMTTNLDKLTTGGVAQGYCESERFCRFGRWTVACGGPSEEHSTPVTGPVTSIWSRFVVLCPVLTPLILAWLVFLLPIWTAHAQPIPPLDVPMRRATQVPQDVDLPYKPPPQDVLESGESTIEDFMLPVAPDATSGETDLEPDGSAAKQFDWTTLPHIPFKRPELKPAPDPEY